MPLSTTPSKTITICYFPGRESSYSRTRTIIKGIAHSGLNVLDCSYPTKRLSRYFFSFLKFLKYRRQADIIFVGFFGHLLLPLVKLLTPKKVMFDAFVSVYLTLVTDRKSFSPRGILAAWARFLDKHACRMADKIFIDTLSQMKYIVSENAVDSNKFVILRPGTDETIMYPRPLSEAKDFLVHFHGEFQALHGTDIIMQAAKLLPHVRFEMIGDGPYLSACQNFALKERLSNVTFLKTVPYEILPEFIAKASICLGIFGDTLKTQMVIPHKVFEAMAMAKPIITADTPAIRELLKNGESVYLCEAANPQRLSDAILKLRDDAVLRNRIGQTAYKIFHEQCSLSIIGAQIRDCAMNLLGQNQ
jgi:glycosyltransferase involved in cell wall biosynthesis